MKSVDTHEMIIMQSRFTTFQYTHLKSRKYEFLFANMQHGCDPEALVITETLFSKKLPRERIF